MILSSEMQDMVKRQPRKGSDLDNRTRNLQVLKTVIQKIHIPWREHSWIYEAEPCQGIIERDGLNCGRSPYGETLQSSERTAGKSLSAMKLH